MRTVEAERVILAPVDTGQLRALGCRIAPSVIGAGVVVDEKSELLGIPFQTGKEVAIDYVIDGHPAVVRYSVLWVQPPNSCVGSRTVVEIQGETPDDQKRLPVRATLQWQLALLKEDIALAKEVGLAAPALVVQAESLRESLQRIF